MKKTLLAAACVLPLAVAALASDDPARIWSEPAVPAREAMDRLNLEVAWAVTVPMDGKRDSFVSIQTDGGQLLAETRSGMTTLLDVERGGRTLWRGRPGRPYQATLPPALNSRSIFANDSGAVYALDRETGALQWKYELRVALSAPLSADEHQLYVENVEARLIAARIPETGKPAASPGLTPPPAGDHQPYEVKQGASLTPEDVRPFIAFDFDTNKRVESKAVLGKSTVFLAIPDGTYLGVPKVGDPYLGNTELYHYAGDSRFSAPPGASEDAAYLATQDSHLYAVAVDSGKVLWRYITGRPVTRTPVAVDVGEGAEVDHDLYVTAEGKGLARLNRDTGEPLWAIGRGDYQPRADRVLGVNPKFVYATDGAGRMLALDRKNGAVLSGYDVHDYAFPVVNNQTDRIYLAANNGLIVCLHDKDYPQPLAYHRAAAPPSEKPLAERVQEAKDKLAKPITDPGGEKVPFKAWVAKVGKDYGLKVFVSNKAFADQKLPLPDDLTIDVPKADNKPLGDWIQEVLGKVNGESTLVEDTLIISPARPMK
jgi:outer membrane protein assembly factor BamB